MTDDVPPHSRRTTLADVAARVGVSAITVSRALRRPDMVSEPLRKRIAEAVDELGYVPDPAARALASRRSNVIGVIIPSITNNVFSDVLTGIYDTLEGTAYDIQLGNSRYNAAKEEALLRVFLSQRPAGLIVTGFDQSPAARRLLETAGCPIVQIMETGGNPVDMMVGFSHFDAAGAATRHLIAQGYRAPAFIGARMDPRSQRRFQGYRAATTEAGVFSEARVLTTADPSNVSLGARLFAELLARAPETDAVLCNNDDLALGVLFEARRQGMEIPGRLGLCGFNDLEMMACAEPPVSSVRTFRQQMGQQGSEMLLARLNGQEPEQRLVNLGYELIVRQSTLR
ncbi:LacI family DNA-binding transcriptional regulator [Puniceibacterium confluentis]|uniref:LacI family DNA-binding transcriptional regulator n=1 Tax=Puniceibacterium confluentis TaxID=1958944 RepID=UPI0035687220